MKMEIRNRPWTDLAKLIRVIESCETKDQLEGMANKMWGAFCKKYSDYNWESANTAYQNKRNQFNEWNYGPEEGENRD